MNEFIIVKDINKSFKKSEILKHVSASFEKGQITGIIGRNGSGKSVLLKIICGLLRQDSGELIIDGEVITDDKKTKFSIGAVIESPGFIPYKSGYRNLRYLADIQRKIGIKEIKDTMELVGLSFKSKKHVGKYSLGMKQRLGIAQALMENPDIIILDEPMNGLDREGVGNIRDVLRNLRDNGKTIIITSHNYEDIDILCDKVYSMDNGNLCISCRE